MLRVVDLIRVCLFNDAVFFIVEGEIAVNALNLILIAHEQVLFGLPYDLAHVLCLELLLVLAERVGCLQGEGERALRSHGEPRFLGHRFVPRYHSI